MSKLYMCDICKEVIPTNRGISFVSNDPAIPYEVRQIDICPYCYEKILNTVNEIKKAKGLQNE